MICGPSAHSAEARCQTQDKRSLRGKGVASLALIEDSNQWQHRMGLCNSSFISTHEHLSRPLHVGLDLAAIFKPQQLLGTYMLGMDRVRQDPPYGGQEARDVEHSVLRCHQLCCQQLKIGLL